MLVLQIMHLFKNTDLGDVIFRASLFLNSKIHISILPKRVQKMLQSYSKISFLQFSVSIQFASIHPGAFPKLISTSESFQGSFVNFLSIHFFIGPQNICFFCFLCVSVLCLLRFTSSGGRAWI